MAARATTPKTPTKGSDLILYRLGLVEDEVKKVGEKLDAREHITKADLIEFREAILQRFTEKYDILQKQIDELKEEKADAKDLQDTRTLLKAAFTFVSTIITALVIYYLTTGAK